MEGAALGAAWGFASAVVLTRLPQLPVVMALFFLGMFLASYLARTSPTRGYVGVQMGFVIALVLVAPPAQSGDLTPVVQRVEGVAVGLATSLVVSSLWPGFGAAAGVTTGSPATTGTDAPPPSRG
jgi:hypothetical protein